MIDYAAILTRNYSGAEWSLNGNGYSGLTWLSDTPKPSQAELDGAWPAVREAMAWDAVRAERDRLLAACDWTQVADAPVDQQAWAIYRQKLRDIPQDFATPDAVVWPEQP